MKIKLFKFPTFEDWLQNSKKARLQLGAYCCEISVFSWTLNSCNATYMFAVALSNTNPHNIYTNKLFCKTFEFDGDMEALKSWYNNTIKEFNVFWEKHIKSRYIEE